MNEPVWPCWVIRKQFKLSAVKWHFAAHAQLIYSSISLLISCQHGMDLVHETPSKVTLLPNPVHHKCYCCLVIAKNINETGRFYVRTSVGDVLFQKPFGHQRLGRSQLEFIQVFNYSCFNAEAPN